MKWGTDSLGPRKKVLEKSSIRKKIPVYKVSGKKDFLKKSLRIKSPRETKSPEKSLWGKRSPVKKFA